MHKVPLPSHKGCGPNSITLDGRKHERNKGDKAQVSRTSRKPPSPPNSLTTTEFRPHSAPTPLMRDVGPNVNAQNQASCQWDWPLRFPKGMREGNTQGGTQEVGGLASASPNVSHDICHGSFSPLPRSFYPTAHLHFQHRRHEKKTPRIQATARRLHESTIKTLQRI